jgi:hypothetical protein
MSFSLDAARVSRTGNPGNLEGLAAVKPGSTVWLMMYYTVKRMPKTVTRVTVYEVDSGSHAIYKIAYKHNTKEVGRFSRYTVYHVPASLAFGPYVFRATLRFGGRSRARAWKFQVAHQEKIAPASHH